MPEVDDTNYDIIIRRLDQVQAEIVKLREAISNAITSGAPLEYYREHIFYLNRHVDKMRSDLRRKA